MGLVDCSLKFNVLIAYQSNIKIKIECILYRKMLAYPSNIFHMPSYIQIIANEQTEQHEMTQKSVHTYCEYLFKTYPDKFKILSVPTIHESENPHEYWFESFSIHKPLLLSRSDLFPSQDIYTQTVNEFVELWKLCWEQGLILYDFSLYYQPDGKIFLRNFEHTAFKQTIHDKVIAKLPGFAYDIETLFKNPCFPSEFIDLIGFLPGY